MASWSKKIYLSFWLTLLFITGVSVIFLPKILDSGKEGSIKGLEAAPRIDFSDESIGQAVTRFPTRPFLEQAQTTAQPSQTQSQASTGLGPGGLPTRTVAGVNEQSVGDRVTTRAYLQANASVYIKPQTTAQILGRVGSQTKVRWLDKAGEGWEEILLKDGRSAYVQSTDLSFSADSARDQQTSFPRQGQSDDPDVGTLPGTVETFLSHLSRDELPRAETYLSPLAPRLGAQDLGPLASYVGVANDGRVNRIEQIGGGRGGHRRVRLVYGPDMLHEVDTLWEWDRSQGRWMLVNWISR